MLKGLIVVARNNRGGNGVNMKIKTINGFMDAPFSTNNHGMGSCGIRGRKPRGNRGSRRRARGRSRRRKSVR